MGRVVHLAKQAEPVRPQWSANQVRGRGRRQDGFTVRRRVPGWGQSLPPLRLSALRSGILRRMASPLQDRESTGRFTASDSQHQQRGSGMSINEIKTTVFGFMGTQPTRLGQPGSTPVCSFRLGSTPAYYDTAAGVWKRKSTTWLTVKAFRTLAVNALACLHKGDPVIVSGSLVTEEWTSDGQPHSSLVLVADGIGHDLARGQDTFTRIRSGDASIDEGADGPDPWTTPPSSSPSETGSAPASSVSSADDRTSVENSNAG